LQDKIFEPRVTSKLDTMVIDQWGVHGRGMALFSIRSNAVEARLASSDVHKGASLIVVTDASQLSERADQSTWPVVERDEHGTLRVVRGPHNIVRRVLEFAVEHLGIELYLGTPSEVLASMIATARQELDRSELLFCDDVNRLPVWQRAAAASDADELVEVAASLGISVSERTAHRVLSDEIRPVSPVLVTAAGDKERATTTNSPDIYRDRRGLKIHHSDLSAFRAELEKAFDAIAERYYLHLKCEPRITVGKDDIRVRFEVEKED
jgi:hypothetical protein